MILKGGKCTKKEQCNDKSKTSPPPLVPSLEVSLTNSNQTKDGAIGYNCTCSRKAFNLGEGAELASLINALVLKRKSGKAKIKVEIDFSD